jgi:hypothetical protein
VALLPIEEQFNRFTQVYILRFTDDSEISQEMAGILMTR